MSREMPRQGADLNSGTYGTDPKFLEAVREEFVIGFDLASSDGNAVTPAHFTEEEDALSQGWPSELRLGEVNAWNWLNPPYGSIGVWAKKTYAESLLGARVLFLVPASVGSNWYRDFCYGKCEVRFLNGRLTFAGHKQPYPKDLMLGIYELGRKPDQIIWSWQ